MRGCSRLDFAVSTIPRKCFLEPHRSPHGHRKEEVNHRTGCGRVGLGWGGSGGHGAEDTHSQGSVCDVDVRGHLLLLATFYFDLPLHSVLTSWLDWLAVSPGVLLSPLLPHRLYVLPHPNSGLPACKGRLFTS